jgi:NADPH:quinone reductase-like Zn-dependent oxidoreductase
LQSVVGLFARAKRARFLMVGPEGVDLAFLGQLADEGLIRPILGLTFPLERALAAQGASEEGHGRGKLVLEVGS